MSSVDLPNRRRATLRQLGQFSRIWSVSRLRRLPCPALWPDSNATARPTEDGTVWVTKLLKQIELYIFPSAPW